MQCKKFLPYLLTVNTESLDSVNSQKLYAKLVVNGHDIVEQQSVNVLPVREYKKVCGDPDIKELKASEAILCTMVLKFTHLVRRELVCVIQRTVGSTLLNSSLLVNSDC